METLEYGQWATYNGERYMITDWEPETTIVVLFVPATGKLNIHSNLFIKFAELSEISDYLAV